MSELVDRIANLKEVVDEAKSERDRLEGEFNASMKQLKALGYETIKEAEAAVGKLQDEVEALETKIEKEVTALESEIEKYEGATK